VGPAGHDRRSGMTGDHDSLHSEVRAVPHVFLYLDPGSGSLLIQALLASMVAVPVLLRNKITAGLRAVRSAVRGDHSDPGSPGAPPNIQSH
jgi:hypothetical protein